MDKSTLEMAFEPARQHHELCALMVVKQVSTRKDREAGEWFWRGRIRGSMEVNPAGFEPRIENG